MRNNAAYLPESPIVYIILPKSIRNRASFSIFVPILEIGGHINERHFVIVSIHRILQI